MIRSAECRFLDHVVPDVLTCNALSLVEGPQEGWAVLAEIARRKGMTKVCCNLVGLCLLVDAHGTQRVSPDFATSCLYSSILLDNPGSGTGALGVAARVFVGASNKQ